MESATINITGSNIGTTLESLLMADEIAPGSDVGYELCKQIYLYHPLGQKMVEKPIDIAMSQPREITIPQSPETMVKEAFEREWLAIGADKHIANVMHISRMYGIGSIIYGAVGVPTDEPINPKDLAGLDLYFNALDPLNTAGSLVLSQDPNSPDFQKHAAIAVSGQPYHRSRSCTILNGSPVYINYTNSAYGFVGRSVYQRALFPLKSFVQSMITDDMVTRKAGLLIAKMKAPGSIIDNMMQKMAAVKRNLLKEAKTNNVMTIGHEESIETLNMMNADGAMTTARKNILENIASAAPMPAKILNNETFAEGFGEGTEDAKATAQYIEGVRRDMAPLYAFFDKIVQYRAWNPEFYKTVQAEFPEYKNVPYTKAFYDWVNSFKAIWPSLLTEPASEKIKVEDTKLKAIIALVEVLMPSLDPDNKALMIQWAADNFNAQKLLFEQPLELDYQALAEYVPPEPAAGPSEPKPFAGNA